MPTLQAKIKIIKVIEAKKKLNKIKLWEKLAQ